MDLEVGKTYKITWLENGFIQHKKLVGSLKEYEMYYTFTTNSPIYKACIDKSYCFELPYSKHCFNMELEKYE